VQSSQTQLCVFVSVCLCVFFLIPHQSQSGSAAPYAGRGTQYHKQKIKL
jgi:hypothetical protein